MLLLCRFKLLIQLTHLRIQLLNLVRLTIYFPEIAITLAQHLLDGLLSIL